MANMTVGEYAWQLLAEQRAVRQIAIAVKRDELTIRRIDENFGELLLTEVTPAHIRAVHTRLRREGAMSEDGIHKMHQKMKQVMRQALYDELIVRNRSEEQG